MVARNLKWAGLAGGAALVLGLWLASPSDEQRVRAQLARLVATMEKTGPESALETAKRADAIANAMTPDALVESGRPEWSTLQGRAEIRRAVAQVRSMLQELRIGLFDVETQLDPSRTTAVQRFTVRATARFSGWSERGTSEVEVRWIRQAEGWRIDHLRMVEVVRPLPDA